MRLQAGFGPSDALGYIERPPRFLKTMEGLFSNTQSLNHNGSSSANTQSKTIIGKYFEVEFNRKAGKGNSLFLSRLRGHF